MLLAETTTGDRRLQADVEAAAGSVEGASSLEVEWLRSSVWTVDRLSGDARAALARESYRRRAEGDLLWPVRRDHPIVAGDGLIEPDTDKLHWHHDGVVVAARRKAARYKAARKQGSCRNKGRGTRRRRP